VLPLAQELILSKYCFRSTLNEGTWRASPALYTPQRVPMRSNGTLARLPLKQNKMPVGTMHKFAHSKPPTRCIMGNQQRKRAQRASS
jgi:hypothetical protein